jgi:hypothetical protein
MAPCRTDRRGVIVATVASICAALPAALIEIKAAEVTLSKMPRARHKALKPIEHVAGGGAATGVPRRLSLWANLGVLGSCP